MGVRASLSALLTSTSLSGNVRVSLSSSVVAAALAGPIRVSASYMVVAQKATRGVWMSLIDSSSQIYGAASVNVTVAAAPTPEYNPYKPIVPDSVRDVMGSDGYAYMEENQETLRQQHNLIQAGDTTFPYQLTVTSSSIQHYRLGAVGRFYHPDYGIIQARYVKFAQMVHVDTPHSPVGLFKTATGLDWVVTNDYNKSNPDLVVGISAPWTLPANGDFGWVIVDGPNLQQIKNLSTSHSLAESFAWADSGCVSNTAAGKILGRRVNKTDIPRLPSGSMWVRTESFSEAQINGIITEATKSLLDSLHSLEVSLAALPSASALRTLQSTVTSLRTTVSNEASARIASDLRLNERISNLDFITVAQLNSAVATAVSGVSAGLANLASRVDSVGANLELLSARVDTLDHVESGLQSQIDSILNLITTLSNRSVSKFPVVDGSVPPNLVYLDDGSLVYTEE